MQKSFSAPLLSRVKSWQLVSLGITGWITLYSAAIISRGAGSIFVGNTQGGCFAMTMALAGIEAKRFKKGGAVPANPLEWITGIDTETVNQMLANYQKDQGFLVEPSQAGDAELGFGVRAIKSGRIVLFETNRWREPAINVEHAQTTDANRKTANGDCAVIVSVGTPDNDTKMFVKQRPISLIFGNELKALLVKAPTTVE